MACTELYIGFCADGTPWYASSGGALESILRDRQHNAVRMERLTAQYRGLRACTCAGTCGEIIRVMLLTGTFCLLLHLTAGFRWHWRCTVGPTATAGVSTLWIFGNAPACQSIFTSNCPDFTIHLENTLFTMLLSWAKTTDNDQRDLSFLFVLSTQLILKKSFRPAKWLILFVRCYNVCALDTRDHLFFTMRYVDKSEFRENLHPVAKNSSTYLEEVSRTRPAQYLAWCDS